MKLQQKSGVPPSPDAPNLEDWFRDENRRITVYLLRECYEAVAHVHRHFQQEITVSGEVHGLSKEVMNRLIWHGWIIHEHLLAGRIVAFGDINDTKYEAFPVINELYTPQMPWQLRRWLLLPYFWHRLSKAVARRRSQRRPAERSVPVNTSVKVQFFATMQSMLAMGRMVEDSKMNRTTAINRLAFLGTVVHTKQQAGLDVLVLSRDSREVKRVDFS